MLRGSSEASRRSRTRRRSWPAAVSDQNHRAISSPLAPGFVAMQPYRVQWLTTSHGRTAFGLAGVPAERVGEVVRFLQIFVEGGDADLPERPPELARPGFIRYCADDLKALYFEGRLATKPGASGDEIVRWFWSETAAGQLLRRVRDRLDGSDDPRSKAAAFGVAR